MVELALAKNDDGARCVCVVSDRVIEVIAFDDWYHEPPSPATTCSFANKEWKAFGNNASAR